MRNDSLTMAIGNTMCWPNIKVLSKSISNQVLPKSCYKIFLASLPGHCLYPGSSAAILLNFKKQTWRFATRRKFLCDLKAAQQYLGSPPRSLLCYCKAVEK